jgi:hypothetical protein
MAEPQRAQRQSARKKRRKPKLSLDVGGDAVLAAAPLAAALPSPGVKDSPSQALAEVAGGEPSHQLTPNGKWHKAGALAQVQVALESRSKALLDAAAVTEPAITALLTEITQRREFTGARLHGLDYRFKGLPSLIRKVLGKWRQDIAKRESESQTSSIQCQTSDQERANILDLKHHRVAETLGHELRAHQIVDLLSEQNDCLRYTMILPDDVYVQGVHATLDALEKSTSPRIRRLKLKNFWRPNDADREYLGLHATFACLVDDQSDAPAYPSGTCNLKGKWTNGTRFEVQWHTEDTIHTKEEQCHLIYEKFRVDLNNDHKAQYWVSDT